MSWKSLHMSWMMVKEVVLVERFRDLNLGVSLTSCSLRLNQIRVTSNFKHEITKAQRDDKDFLKTIALVGEGKLKSFTRDTNGLWKFEEKVCIPASSDLQRKILEEAHKSHFTIHPTTTKMYLDLKKMFQWPEMKRDIVE